MANSKEKRNPAQRTAPASSKSATASSAQKSASSSQVSGAAARQARRAPIRRKAAWWPWIAGAVALVALIVGFFFFRQTTSIAGLESYPGQTQNHVEGTVKYAQTPPVGGDHNAVPQKCDVYSQPVQNEKAVHSMEHGAVWITYRPDLPTDQIAQLTTLVRGQSYLLLSPYPDLPAPVVASAWGLQVKLDSASDPRLPQFIKAYRQGPQTPEPGATC